MKRTILTALAVLCLLAPPLRAQEVTTKEQDIRRLLELTGSSKLAAQVMDQMMAMLQESSPELEEEFWATLRAEIDTQELVRRMIPIYDKHFTQDEIRQLIAFYQTPIGLKLVEKLPAIAQESMETGMEWGQEIALKTVEKIQAQQEKKKKQKG